MHWFRSLLTNTKQERASINTPVSLHKLVTNSRAESGHRILFLCALQFLHLLLIFLLSFSSPLLPHTHVFLVRPLQAELAAGLELLHLVRRLDNLNRALLATGDTHVLALDLGGCGKFLLSGVTSLQNEKNC
jgi:hypothetical protein